MGLLTLVILAIVGVGVYTGLKTGWDLDEMIDVVKGWFTKKAE